MKRAKLLSFLLAGSLLFQTAGIDAMATQASDPAIASESVEDPDKASDTDGSENTEVPSADEGNSDLPSTGDEETKDPVENEEDPDRPSTGGEETKDPAENEEDPDHPSIGDEETKDPTENEEDPDLPSTGDERGETPSEDGDTDTSDESLPSEDSVSENTISENTISENTLPEEEEVNAFDIFPGLGDNYVLSSQQLVDKKTLSAHVSDVVNINDSASGYYPDAEGLYELGEVLYMADTVSEAEQVAEAFGGTLDSYAYKVAVIKLPEKATVAMAVAAAADPEIKLPAVWPNYYNYLYNDTAVTASATDPDFAKQWQHDYIGTSYAYAAGYKGAGVRVAVIDTGLEKAHPDLSANAENGKNFVGLTGTNPSIPTLNTDNQTHGTHVAGIIAADDNAVGGRGIAPDATVCGFCVFSANPNAGANMDDIIRAINAAVEEDYDIINMSLGGPQYNDIYAKAIKAAYDSGVAIFAASGNEDVNANAFPASYPGAISVGAVDQNSAKATFSNYGSTVKLSFPGVGIYSTLPSSTYGYMSGTSQACPAAAGTAAVILSARDDIQKKNGKAKVDALLSAMKSSTTKCTSSNMGAGTTWLPGVLKIATDMTAPDMPKIEIGSYNKDNRGNYITESVNVTLSTKTAVGVEIYYTTDGKNPTYKNGTFTNATLYTGGNITLGGAKKVTIKAVALNPITGKMSKVASQSFALAPLPTRVDVSPANNVTRIAAGKSLKLTATVTPSYAASTKVKWSVDAAATAAYITVDNSGTVKTKATKAATTPARTYTVTATALGSDGKPLSAIKKDFSITVIQTADIKKVAFIENNKAYKAPALNVTDTLDLKPYLQVTKQDNSAGAATDVVWFSSNPKVATVTNGVVTAIASGKATIKAISNDGGNKNASCNITVNQPVVSITIPSSMKVAAGKTIALSAEINKNTAQPTNKNLTWTVAGNDKVTVNASGKVNAKKDASGTCTVTATAKDGSNIVSNPCTITIISGEITKIELSQKTLTLFSPNAAKNNAKNAPTTATLSAKVDGKTGCDKTQISWTSSAPDIVAVNNAGKVTAKTAGKATITCASTDGSNKKATCTVNVTIPMSKLAIGPADSWNQYDAANDEYIGVIAAGKNIKMSARYSSSYGVPTNKNITWKSSNPNILTVDKTGKVTANKNAAIGSSAIITATATDGSGVTSNQYTFVVQPCYDDLIILYDKSVDGYVVYGGVYNKDTKDWTTYRPFYYTVSCTGGKNPGCGKDQEYITDTNGNVTESYYYLTPVPGQATTNKTANSSGIVSISPKDCISMKLSVQLRDGSGRKASYNVKAFRLNSGGYGYYER